MMDGINKHCLQFIHNKRLYVVITIDLTLVTIYFDHKAYSTCIL